MYIIQQQSLLMLMPDMLCFSEESGETVALLEDNIKDLESERESLANKLQASFETRREQEKVGPNI